MASLRPSTDGQDVQRRVSRKLRKKQQGEHRPRFDLPEPLRDEDDDVDDEPAPSQGPPMFMNMNQSIFGLIAAAGSKVDFNERFDGSSSEDEGDERGEEDLSKTTILQRPQKTKKESQHQRKLSSHRLLQSVPNLSKLKSITKRGKSKRTTGIAGQEDEGGPSTGTSDPTSPRRSVSEPPEIKLTREDSSRLAPVMSRMLDARAEVSGRPSFDVGRPSLDADGLGESEEVSRLARRLMQIFEFDAPEKVLQGMPLPETTYEMMLI